MDFDNCESRVSIVFHEQSQKKISHFVEIHTKDGRFGLMVSMQQESHTGIKCTTFLFPSIWQGSDECVKLFLFDTNQFSCSQFETPQGYILFDGLSILALASEE
jgi:hypothetical protein